MVWEESIVLMPKSVRFAFLSATIPNAMEFAEWIARTHRCLTHSCLPAPAACDVCLWLNIPERVKYLALHHMCSRIRQKEHMNVVSHASEKGDR